MVEEVCLSDASISYHTATNTGCAGAGNIGADPTPFVPHSLSSPSTCPSIPQISFKADLKYNIDM
jgi:hypothetical protein